MINNNKKLAMTSRIVAAFVENARLPTGELPALIRSVYEALESPGAQIAERPDISLQPAVSVRKSITEDYLICLEDGQKLKMLKRYLRSRHGLTPEAYRAKWGLPADYPMVAPNYAAKLSNQALSSGLGTTRRKPVTTKGPARR